MLVDDLLLAPFRGLLWIFEQVNDAAQEEMAGEAAAITEELRQLYMMLEAGQITEAEFDGHERTLLDRLQAAQARQLDREEEEDEEEDQGVEDDGGDGDGEGDDLDGAGEAGPENE